MPPIFDQICNHCTKYYNITKNLRWILITFVSNGPKYLGKNWFGCPQEMGVILQKYVN